MDPRRLWKILSVRHEFWCAHEPSIILIYAWKRTYLPMCILRFGSKETTNVLFVKVVFTLNKTYINWFLRSKEMFLVKCVSEMLQCCSLGATEKIMSVWKIVARHFGHEKHLWGFLLWVFFFQKSFFKKNMWRRKTFHMDGLLPSTSN